MMVVRCDGWKTDVPAPFAPFACEGEVPPGHYYFTVMTAGSDGSPLHRVGYKHLCRRCMRVAVIELTASRSIMARGSRSTPGLSITGPPTVNSPGERASPGRGLR